MNKTANLNIRIDPTIKADAEQLFSRFGITVSDAVNIFLRKAIMEGGLPFEMKQPAPEQSERRSASDSSESGVKPNDPIQKGSMGRKMRMNAQTEAAMREAEGIASGKIPAKRYASAKVLFEEIDREC